MYSAIIPYRKLDDRIHKLHSQIKGCEVVLSYDEGRGASFARNSGAKKAKGDILIFLDSDVEVPNNLIAMFDKYFKEGRDVVVGRYGKSLGNAFAQRFKCLQERYWTSDIPHDNHTPFIAYCGAIRKDLFIKTGGFNERYKGADVEDYEITDRILKYSRIYYAPEIQVAHHFPNMSRLLKNYFKRTAQWVELRQGRFDTNATTKEEATKYILYILCFPAALYLDRKFLKMARDEGIMIKAALFNLLLAWFIVGGAFFGMAAVLYQHLRKGRS